MLMVEVDHDRALRIAYIIEYRAIRLVERAGREDARNLRSGHPEAVPPSASRLRIPSPPTDTRTMEPSSSTCWRNPCPARGDAEQSPPPITRIVPWASSSTTSHP